MDIPADFTLKTTLPPFSGKGAVTLISVIPGYQSGQRLASLRSVMVSCGEALIWTLRCTIAISVFPCLLCRGTLMTQLVQAAASGRAGTINERRVRLWPKRVPALSYAPAMLDTQVEADTIGAAWLGVARRILDEGTESAYDSAPILELERVTLGVARPASVDPIVTEFGDAERLAWMHANFTDHALVAALGDARSYASRLYDYAATGRDQVQWVIDRLRADPSSRSATITTFEPLSDTTYIPCVSLLDFWIRERQLQAIVYAHSIDFGAKGYGNLVELAYLMERVAEGVKVEVGRLDFVVKSAHIYEPDISLMRNALSALAA